MKKDLHVITLHGVGNPPADYADKAMSRLADGLAKRGCTLKYQSVHYDPILAAASIAFSKDQLARGLDNQPTSRLVDGTLSDALAGTNPRIQEKIFDLIDQAYVRLRAREVVIIGHSMGCKHALDYLHSRQLARCGQLVTLACNAAFWYLGDKFPVPRQAHGGRWLNVVEKDDALGRYMEGVTGNVAIDLEVKLGGWLSWSGAAHTAYWRDRELFGKTLPAFLTV